MFFMGLIIDLNREFVGFREEKRRFGEKMECQIRKKMSII